MVRQRGFTLMEVLVAVAVLAIAMGAIIKAGSENTANAVQLRDKTFAHWVAMNKATELRVERAWPGVGNSNGTVEMAERVWEWRLRVADTPDPDLRRLDIEVRVDGAEHSAAVLVAFLGRPPDAPGEPGRTPEGMEP